MNKIKQEYLEKIQDQQKKLNSILHEVGVIEAQKHGLLHKFAGINQEVEDFKNQLESEYGAIKVNVEDGTYVEVNKEELENV
tara:strand:- start:355 stop:600 length:246 start_codon:yes stop_codon:yes gene_type:complete